MKYCLKCGEIVADNSASRDRTNCAECNTPYEEDCMTGNMFESLPELKKQKYADELFAKIKDSDIFDENLFNEHVRSYGEASLYQSWWYDKAKELGSTFCLRYETDEQRKKRLDEQYGKGSKLYEEAVVRNCIEADRDRKSESQVKCVYCNSTSVQKISTSSKVVNTALFGIFGTKRHKQWHCNNCNSDF